MTHMSIIKTLITVILLQNQMNKAESITRKDKLWTWKNQGQTQKDDDSKRLMKVS